MNLLRYLAAFVFHASEYEVINFAPRALIVRRREQRKWTQGFAGERSHRGFGCVSRQGSDLFIVRPAFTFLFAFRFGILCTSFTRNFEFHASEPQGELPSMGAGLTCRGYPTKAPFPNK